MKYYLISGEASGDLHGSNLMKALQVLDHQPDFRCWGGDLMKAAGGNVVKHYRDLAFMGFTEVVKNIFTIFKNFEFCKQDILSFNPDVIIFIDYPGFNLRMAKWAKENNFKVIYYISPQIWAWKEKRVHQIKKYVDKMLVILPFEEAFYKKWNYPVEYVGHPLVEVVEDFLSTHKKNTEHSNTIALLPGSRKQEISKKLPIMLEVSKNFPNYNFVVAKAPGLPSDFYEQFLQPYKNVSAIENKTYHLLSEASAALVTSGTATLETALFGVPEIICYKGNAISYQIAKRLVNIKYIGLVNLIMDKLVVKELIQDALTVENITAELHSLLENQEKKKKIASDYAALRSLLSKGGHASTNAANSIWKYISTSPAQ